MYDGWMNEETTLTVLKECKVRRRGSSAQLGRQGMRLGHHFRAS